MLFEVSRRPQPFRRRTAQHHGERHARSLFLLLRPACTAWAAGAALRREKVAALGLPDVAAIYPPVACSQFLTRVWLWRLLFWPLSVSHAALCVAPSRRTMVNLE